MSVGSSRITIVSSSRIFTNSSRSPSAPPQTAETMFTLFNCPLDRCVSKSISRMLSITSPKNSTRTASPSFADALSSSFPDKTLPVLSGAYISTIPPRRANCPGKSTLSTRSNPLSTSQPTTSSGGTAFSLSSPRQLPSSASGFGTG